MSQHCQKVLLLLSSTQSLCVKGLMQLQELQKLRSLSVVDVPIDCFQFTEECPFAIMLVPESSVLSIVVVVVPKVNTTEGGDVKPVILKELQGKGEEEWF